MKTKAVKSSDFLQKALELAVTRLEICRGRMEACHWKYPEQHRISVGEVPLWIEEHKATLKKVQQKTKWTSKLPIKEGWIWVKYKGKKGTVICPAEVYVFNKQFGGSFDGIVIQTARNDCFVRHDLKELKFGPVIPFPS